jgi:hypothetical protein
MILGSLSLVNIDGEPQTTVRSALLRLAGALRDSDANDKSRLPVGSEVRGRKNSRSQEPS